MSTGPEQIFRRQRIQRLAGRCASATARRHENFCRTCAAHLGSHRLRNTSGNCSDAFIYCMDDGDPRVIAVIPGGGRTTGGIRHATIERGLLRVERLWALDRSCCPEWVEIRNYQLRSGRLVEVGMLRKRKFVEPE